MRLVGLKNSQFFLPFILPPLSNSEIITEMDEEYWMAVSFFNVNKKKKKKVVGVLNTLTWKDSAPEDFTFLERRVYGGYFIGNP